jgi:hypothetical protein
MKLKAITSASAILWGACMLLVGLLHLGFRSYGTDFLQMMSSVYPGFHASRTFGDVVIGTIYGFVDGAILGCVFGWLYRWAGGKEAHATIPAAEDTAALRTLLRRVS